MPTLTDDAEHILVVDDDRRLRALLASFLGKNGYRVTTAASAAEARGVLETLEFDLIVLDVMMPGESGVAFAERLRETSDVEVLDTLIRPVRWLATNREWVTTTIMWCAAPAGPSATWTARSVKRPV